ncbi:hypothetical protein J1N35_042148 [Gossypium stocksii]|uniref:RNase H type-1 domain-containing protein n=1 Tax=Gossypium stocksii TaxID=47602 RepID=A0A9D3ZJ98_9ROSI|nr:hypothetical protein J1N35_042148 [Gossypium stocksii]
MKPVWWDCPVLCFSVAPLKAVRRDIRWTPLAQEPLGIIDSNMAELLVIKIALEIFTKTNRKGEACLAVESDSYVGCFTV